MIDQYARLHLGAVELNFLDVARVCVAAGAALRLRVLLPQPRRHLTA